MMLMIYVVEQQKVGKLERGELVRDEGKGLEMSQAQVSLDNNGIEVVDNKGKEVSIEMGKDVDANLIEMEPDKLGVEAS